MRLPTIACLSLILATTALPARAAPTAADGSLDPAGAALSAADLEIYRRAFEAASKHQWRQARKIAASANDALAAKALEWLYLRQPGNRADFATYTAFLEQSADWPDLARLHRRAETALKTGVGDAEVIAWFADHRPYSAAGRLRLAEALIAQGLKQAGRDWLRHTWIADTHRRSTSREIYRRHRALLSADDHWARLDRLLWKGHRSSAQGMLGVVSKDRRRLATARMGLMRRAGGVDGLIAAVPASLHGDPGLLFERTRWRRRAGKDVGAREFLLAPPGELGPRPKRWWIERRIVARKALAAGDLSAAYQIAARHRQAPGGAAFAEAEWLAGWIALRFLDDRDLAYGHFARIYPAVKYPISRARAAYWAGRAAEALRQPDLVRRWYGLAARHRTTFYGQLAAVALGLDRRWQLPPTPMPNDADRERFDQRELAGVVRRLAALGQRKLLRPFFLQLQALAETPGERSLVALLAESIDRPDIAVRVSKHAARDGIILVERAYPVLSLPNAAAETALLLALSRQESEFDQRAISSAGARGLMQLMPATAKQVAKSLSLPYRKSRLLDDPGYNARLGSRYLGDLLGQYDGSYVLALAAYNAGPSRVKHWIREHGDPRDADVDAIDWIERIPIEETRNYVQRVIEGLQVYRQRLSPRRLTLRIAEDLNRGRR